jgi:hypothetical protein
MTVSFLPSAVAAGGTVKDKDECAALYSDEEAVALTDSAILSASPTKQVSRLVVLQRLGVDPQRLCNRRVYPMNMSHFERWQISKSFDLTWTVPVGNPKVLEKEDRRVFNVRILKISEPFPPREDAVKTWRRVHRKAAQTPSR